MLEIGSDFVQRLDSILVKRDLKRKALAEFVGISVQSITDWSKRGNVPAADIALKMAEFLGVSIEWLITGKEPEKLSIEERQLIEKFRALGEVDKEAARTLIEILSSKNVSGKKEAKKQTDSGDLVLMDSAPDYGVETIDTIEAEVIDMGDIIMIPCFGLTAAGKPIDTYAVTDDFIPFPKKLLAASPEEYFFLRVRGFSMVEAGINSGDIILLRRTNIPLHDRIMLVSYDNATTIKRIRLDNAGHVWLCWNDGSGRKVQVTSDQCQIQGALVWHGSENLKNQI